MITIIAAMTEDKVIGYENKVPWHCKADLQHFRSVTTGYTIVMGRKTYESIGKPLPGRKNIILSRSHDFHDEEKDLFTIRGWDELPYHCPNGENIFVIGGAKIYDQAIEFADKMILSTISSCGYYEGDAYFPEYDKELWVNINTRLYIPESPGVAKIETFINRNSPFAKYYNVSDKSKNGYLNIDERLTPGLEVALKYVAG